MFFSNFEYVVLTDGRALMVQRPVFHLLMVFSFTSTNAHTCVPIFTHVLAHKHIHNKARIHMYT